MNFLYRQLPWIASIIVLAIILLVTISSSQATDCHVLATGFDEKHKRVIQQNVRGSDAYFSNLYKIEDEIFTAMKQCNDSTPIITAMGELQLSLGQVPLAQLYGEKAVNLDNDDWNAHYVLGSALNLQKKYVRGLEHLQLASKLQPDNYSLTVNLCSSYEKNGKFQQAINTCSQVIEKGPYDLRGTAYYLRALARKGNNEPALAEKDIKFAKEFGFQQ